MSDSLSDIRREFQRVAPEVVQRASQYAASILADVAGRRGTHGRAHRPGRAARCAWQVRRSRSRSVPGDNLMIHAAMALAKPGDILVIDGKADRTCALMGAIMTSACKKLGLGGVVIDAAIRDSDELRELGFPVYAVGTNPNGPTKFVPGRINWPVSCGGAVVHPGDLVVGDADGVVVIEREKAASLLDAAAAKVADEKNRFVDIAAGRNLTPNVARSVAARRRRAEARRDVELSPVPRQPVTLSKYSESRMHGLHAFTRSIYSE